MPESSELPPLRLYNTATNSVEPVRVADPSAVTFYTCGPTVYDDAHIGNFRSFLAADLLRRFIESPLCTITDLEGTQHTGPRTVRHVMNITDVGHMTEDSRADGGGEDKMATAADRLEAAKKAGTLHQDADIDPSDPAAIARFYADRFIDDASTLGLKVAIDADTSDTRRRELMPFATEHIDGMKQVIADLLRSGAAYTAGKEASRAIYFDVSTFPTYGTLSGNTLDKLTSGAGGRVTDAAQSEKRNPADFLLWKEDESHLMKWPAPDHPACAGWGLGYPGWHIECTAMSLNALARNLDAAKANSLAIDLHSGGEDNIFPHHECENAQSCAFTGSQTFARHWFHPRFLMVEGKKMSKSAGTFYTARQLFEQGIEPAALRLELIKSHYRSNADFSMQGLKDSQRQVDRWREFKARAEQGDPGEMKELVRDAFAAALADDLNISGALGILNKWINETKAPTKADADLIDRFNDVLGVLDRDQLARAEFEIGVFLPGVTPSPEIEQLLLDRADAKKAKDFATADAIRDQLAAMNLAIKDVAGGKVEVGPA